MLARRSVLQHPSGLAISTPLLVPSFSSKGFAFRHDGLSEVSDALETVSEYLTESMMVSAYDLHHKHIPWGFESVTDVVFVDSGGYELAIDHDLSSTNRHPSCVKIWNEDLYCSVLDEWPEHCPAVFISLDIPSDRKPVSEQIECARALLGRYPKQLHDVILKPSTKGQRYVQVKEVLDCIQQLSGIQIIGFAEKELGNSLLERLKSIVAIRRALDEAAVHAPIHVFGSLDPLTSILYFIAGAEIFDGLTWLRYSYLGGTAIYPFNYGAISIGIHKRDDFVRGRSLADNISCLEKLELQMRGYVREGKFGVFGDHSDVIEQAYQMLCNSAGGTI